MCQGRAEKGDRGASYPIASNTRPGQRQHRYGAANGYATLHPPEADGKRANTDKIKAHHTDQDPNTPGDFDRHRQNHKHTPVRQPSLPRPHEPAPRAPRVPFFGRRPLGDFPPNSASLPLLPLGARSYCP